MKTMLRTVAIRVVVAGACVALACCAPPAHTGNFDSPDPAARLYAITRAGETKDASKIPSLVDQLDSDDPAVRLFAIEALERITGERLGYNPYADDTDRRESVDRWVEAVKARRFAVGRDGQR